MNKFDIYELLKRTEGHIYPIGETNHDANCLKHIENWIDLADAIITELHRVANINEEDRAYASIGAVSDKARSFLKCLSYDLNEDIKEWEV